MNSPGESDVRFTIHQGLNHLIMKSSFLFPVILLASISISCEKLLLNPEEVHNPPPVQQRSRLATLLDSLRFVMDLPALAAAVVSDTGCVELAVVGCRRYGGPENVTINDRFHLGSCGKAFTAALIGSLVDDGLVNWNTTLPAIFPEYVSIMRQEYRDVTVRDILSHSSGFTRDVPVDLPYKSQTTSGRRLEAVAWAVSQPPAQVHGQYLYSNLAFITAGAVAEKLTGRTYEDLLMERIIRPLGITTAGFGAMGTPGCEDQPLQHSPDHAPIIARSDASLNPIYNPAGGLYMSVGDWGRFCQWVLASEAGHQTLLRPATARALTAPVTPITPGSYYAFGWGVWTDDSWSGGKSLTHSGSNGYNYSSAALAPLKRWGIVVLTNQGAIGGDWLLGPAVNRLITYQNDGQ